MVYYLYNSDKPLSRLGKIIVLAIAVIVLFTIGSTFIPSLSIYKSALLRQVRLAMYH